MDRRYKRLFLRFSFTAVLAVIGLIGVASALVSLRVLPGSPVLNHPPSTVPLAPETGILHAGLLDGSQRAAFEYDFENSLATTRLFQVLWNRIVYLLFAQALPGVQIGKREYIFTSEEWYEDALYFEFRHSILQEAIQANAGFRNPSSTASFWSDQSGEASVPPSGTDIDQEYPASILLVAETLENRGIQLVVVLVPAKNRILGGLANTRLSSRLSGRYNDAVRTLSSLGIQVLDLETAFRNHPQMEALYMRTDTHWSPEGARIAAQALAGFITGQGLLSRYESLDFETRISGTESFRGDLFEFFPMPTNADPALPLIRIGPFSRFLPKPEILTRYATFPVTSPSIDASTGAEAATSVAAWLFATPVIPVALTGTSYSAGEDWNFPGFLMEALGTDLINLAQAGKGPFEPMAALLVDPVLQEVGVELVIWEIPERYLLP
jgi:hypothetical protein